MSQIQSTIARATAGKSTYTNPWYVRAFATSLFFLLTSGPAAFRWMVAAAFLVFPPFYLAYHPDQYTPLVSTLFSIFLFALAYWIGNKSEIAKARQQANDRWLPQAESVISRLMTLRVNVVRFSSSMKCNCSNSECEMPELKTDALRTVRVKMKTDCDAASQRLDDIGHQLEDAIDDWRRFVAANCRGEECGRIFDALSLRHENLMQDLAAAERSKRPQSTLAQLAGVPLEEAFCTAMHVTVSGLGGTLDCGHTVVDGTGTQKEWKGGTLALHRQGDTWALEVSSEKGDTTRVSIPVSGAKSPFGTFSVGNGVAVSIS